MPDELATTMEPPAGTPGKPGPALSATNDMPVITDAPPLTEERVPGQAKAAPEPGAPEPELTEPEELPGEQPAPRRSRTSERIRELNERAKAAEAREAGLIEALRDARRSENRVPEARDDPKPARSTFDDPEAYDTALTAWAARDGARTALAEIRQQQAQAEAQRTQATVQAKWAEAVEKSADKYPDFEEVVYRDDITITIPMFNAIVNAENGPDVAYYLGQNAKEAKRIASLPTPAQQAMEIGRLTVKLAEPAPRASRAPAPIRPVGARSPAAERSPNEMSMEEYAAKRNAEMAAERRQKLGLSTA